MASSAFAVKSLPVMGEKPDEVTLAGDAGGLVEKDQQWSSSSLKGKLHLLVYVDPDESDANNALTKRLKKENFGPEILGSVAVINMAATWKPNFIIQKILQGKQEEYPTTTYVMDKDKVLVEQWQLKDDAYDVLLFDHNGKVIFRKDGVLNAEEIDQVVELIKQRANQKAS
jgi:hypothetical protein